MRGHKSLSLLYLVAMATVMCEGREDDCKERRVECVPEKDSVVATTPYPTPRPGKCHPRTLVSCPDVDRSTCKHERLPLMFVEYDGMCCRVVCPIHQLYSNCTYTRIYTWINRCGHMKYLAYGHYREHNKCTPNNEQFNCRTGDCESLNSIVPSPQSPRPDYICTPSSYVLVKLTLDCPNPDVGQTAHVDEVVRTNVQVNYADIYRKVARKEAAARKKAARKEAKLNTNQDDAWRAKENKRIQRIQTFMELPQCCGCTDCNSYVDW